MRAMRFEGDTTAPPEMSERPPTPHAPHRLRSRAEQIADELAAQNRDPEPTTRRLPGHEPPVKQQIPGR